MTYYFSILKFTTILSYLCLTACSTSSSNYTQVTREAQHRTKVWILNNHPLIEHPQISDLFSRSLSRLSEGVKVLGLVPETKNINSITDSNNTNYHPAIYLINSNELSAFSLCDGSIFLTRAILLSAPSINELMAIISHELAHVIRRDACHVHKTKDKELELENEFAADSISAKILYHSYIDPEAALFGLELSNKSTNLRQEQEYRKEIEARKKALLKQIQGYPRIETKIPDERLFRKVKSLVK